MSANEKYKPQDLQHQSGEQWGNQSVMTTFENSTFKHIIEKCNTMIVDCFAYYKSPKYSRFHSIYLHLSSERGFFSVLAKQSMFKCLTTVALNKSGSTGILILPCWSLARLGPLPFENQIKSIMHCSGCIIFDEYSVRAERF